MRRKTLLSLLAALPAALLILGPPIFGQVSSGPFEITGDSDAGRPAAPAASTPVTAEEKDMAARENDFGFHLLRATDRGDSKRNTFLSPLSMSQAMTMLYAGASGATRDEIGGALQLSGLSLDQVGSGARALREQIAGSDHDVQLEIANALWANQGIEFRPSYIDECERNFDARASTLDFHEPEAAGTINQWVSDKTHGRITTIVSPEFLRGAGAVLTDAVYFHGSWTQTFNENKTEPAPFTDSDGQSKSVPMMTRTGGMSAADGDDYQAVRLPYGDGSDSMVIVLPKAGRSVDDMARSLTPDSWSSLKSGMSQRPVELYLPRFHVDYSASLVDALKDLGIHTAFGHSADFSPMSETPMYVSDVLHKTTLDVDEKGTVATAATAIGMMPLAVMEPPRNPLVIRVDHPFLCAIQNDDTGAILFLGVIRDPQAVTKPTDQ